MDDSVNIRGLKRVAADFAGEVDPPERAPSTGKRIAILGGGGQPIHDGEERAFERGKKLYDLDQQAELRFSHENPDVRTMYERFFGNPNSHKAHMLLHTIHEKAAY